MTAMHCTSYSTALRDLVRAHTSRGPLPPAFLIPTFAQPQKLAFSTSTAARARKDGNPRRGMSALKRSGLGRKFELKTDAGRYPLPKPEPKRKTAVAVDPNHGLWGFFDTERTALMTPEALSHHGRAWTVAELRKKDFDDLWRLYWTCIREVNRINTYELERTRLKIHFGEHEAQNRLQAAQKTQKAIKHALTERWYQFESARELAMSDPEVDLNVDITKGESGYTPTEDVFQPLEENEQDADTSAERIEEIRARVGQRASV